MSVNTVIVHFPVTQKVTEVIRNGEREGNCGRAARNYPSGDTPLKDKHSRTKVAPEFRCEVGKLYFFRLASIF